MSANVICVDQSTTNTKVFLYDTSGHICYESTRKHQQIYPQSGWVEHDPMELYENVRQGLREAIAHADQKILGVCLTNQRETIVLWDQYTGKPVHNAIVWQCRRTADMCRQYEPYEALVEEKTGLKIDPYFSATKLRWLLDHYDHHESYYAGTIDAWLLYKLCGRHVCDPTNASRTLLYNIKEHNWDQELMRIFDIPSHMLPTIIDSDGDFGEMTIDGITLPVLSVMGDSQSALVGHDACHVGDVKITLGTGSSVMMNQGTAFKKNAYGVVSAVAYHTSAQCAYASEAIINCSGDTLNWLREDLKLYQCDQEVNTLSMDSHGVYLVPAFVGLGIPYWNAKAKACISGISRATTREDIMVAGVQSIAFQVYDALLALQKQTGIKAKGVSVDGGASRNPLLMQLIADLCEQVVTTYEDSNFSALGVVRLAMHKLGIGDIQARHLASYTPMMKQETRSQMISGWKQAIDMVIYDSERR